MTLNVETLLAILGVVGVGLLAFFRIRKAPVGIRREHEIEVAGQRKVDAIQKKAADEAKTVNDAWNQSRAKDPSDALRDLIDKGDIPR